MEAFTKILSIAVGGAAGAVARYLVNISPLANLFEKFPFPTFFINVTGSFLIGFLFILLNDRFQVHDDLRLALIVGFLGAFTTFSTFELELYGLVKEGSFLTAFAYLFLSVAAGFVGVAAGILAGRRV
ncbi:MAG: fluoride efflux transporter CrcB [Acidobacteriota bacterium]